MSETRARFLREIVARIPVERIVEVHVFPALRQGGLESGVAVIAATFEPEPEPPAMPDETGATDVAEAAPEAAPEPAPAQMAMDELLTDTDACAIDEAAAGEADAADSPPPRPVRHTVYTARYRQTLKGPDRGKWEFSLVAEADAPLVTVDAIVRGVQRRAADAADPERLTAETLPAALDDVTWTPTPA